ncbi:MAG: hypothetical protein JWO52_4467 [Gammaproteobacteria bacterium]|nr:hypothetical protein [Gammaproteobacteria bacterium]
MNGRQCGAFPALCALAIVGAWAAPVLAQTAEVKEKPRMYTYVSNWTVPRAHWADMEKQAAANTKIFDKAIASGGLVGYGNDENLVHQADGDTHDTFWSALSMAGILNVLDDLRKGGASTAAALNNATKHSDALYVTRFYNWKAGTMKGAYTHGASYKLKADAPDDAVATLSKSFIVPLLEKLLADGTIQEYEVDVEAIHTEAPGTFWVYWIAPAADGVDKVNAALGDALKAQPLAAPALDSMVDSTAHRDYLARTDATYK